MLPQSVTLLKSVLNAGDMIFEAYPEVQKINDSNWKITWINSDCTVEVTNESNGFLFRELHPQSGDIITELENLTGEQLLQVFKLYEE